MNLRETIFSVVSACSLLGMLPVGQVLAQEKRGLNFGDLSVSPYVNCEYIYDSNVRFKPDGQEDTIYSVTPGFDINYRGNEWGLDGNAYYTYDWYRKNDVLDSDRYGERLSMYKESEKGWRVSIGEGYLRSNQEDSLVNGQGEGTWCPRENWDINAALAYEFSERFKATLSAIYSELEYLNDEVPGQVLGNYLYGYSDWTVSLELAHKLTEKSNLLLLGSYQTFTSDMPKTQGISSDSVNYTLQGGFGSRLTERIRYRALLGASMMDYAEAEKFYGWTYNLDMSWMISKKWAATVAGASYFQPSEGSQPQVNQVYALSGGLTYKPFKRVTTGTDLAYRRDDRQGVATGTDSTSDQVSLRLKADYELVRYVKIYTSIEYMERMSDNKASEWDRVRGVLGLAFRY